MNRLDEHLKKKSSNLLSVYFTAGYPGLDDTPDIIQLLENNGADLIEIGMPFSDPMADGPVIQKSSSMALKNGMNLGLLFQQLAQIRKSVSIPLVLMGYLNPVYRFGMERFCRHCQETGIDGVILPDLPLEVYHQEFKELFDQYGLYNIFLVSPTTSENRLKKIVEASQGFVYMVSSTATTGDHIDVQSHIDYIRGIRSIRPDLPVLMGFGIDSHQKFRQVCAHANGGIIGSAFIRALEKTGTLEGKIRGFMEEIQYDRYDYSTQ